MDKDFKRDLHDIVTEHDKASEKQLISVILAGVLILEQAGGSYFGYLKGALESTSFLAPDYFGVGGGAITRRCKTLLRICLALAKSTERRSRPRFPGLVSR